MKENKKLSILMPVYNEEKYISQAINSILNQSYKNFELIIVDDFSTDNSYNICKKFASQDDRIKLSKNNKKGKVFAFNLAYTLSKGIIFCSVHGDDRIPRKSFEKRIKPLIPLYNDLVSSVCKIQTISNIDNFNNIITPRSKNLGAFLGGTIMYTRKIADIIYPIPIKLASEDKWQVLCIENFTNNICHIPEILYYYRIHENNSSSRVDCFKNKNISMHGRFIVYDLFLQNFKKKITNLKEKELLALNKAENLRFKGNSFKILFIKNLSLKNKIRFIFHSNKYLYWIRIRLYSFFSGWG